MSNLYNSDKVRLFVHLAMGIIMFLLIGNIHSNR
jgi:hypothetical protein